MTIIYILNILPGRGPLGSKSHKRRPWDNTTSGATYPLPKLVQYNTPRFTRMEPSDCKNYAYYLEYISTFYSTLNWGVTSWLYFRRDTQIMTMVDDNTTSGVTYAVPKLIQYNTARFTMLTSWLVIDYEDPVFHIGDRYGSHIWSNNIHLGAAIVQLGANNVLGILPGGPTTLVDVPVWMSSNPVP